ncbi:MAG: hypothetical protein OXC10_05000 [Rhodospirillaceae bacterium]|nr:hypothetical protein [Rhodospirillaceae bacterium]
MSSRLGIAGIVLLAAFGLAACGGGGGGTATMQEPTQAQLDAMKIAELQKEINDLRAQLGLEADDDLSGSVTELQNQVTSLQTQIREAKEAEEEAEAKKMRMEMAAAGKALKAALTSNPLGLVTSVTHAATGLTVATADAGDTDPELRAGDSAGTIGDWKGTHYAVTNPGTKVSDTAVVYGNQAAPTVKPFATGASFGADQDAFDAAYTASTRTLDLGSDPASTADIKGDPASTGDKFPTAGTKTYQNAEAEQVEVKGTYQGAPGKYTCSAAACTATVGTGGAIDLGGQWYFVHNSGAMVSTPDPNYLIFGWWLNKDKDGKPTAASAFTGIAGTAPDVLTGVNSIVGSATYTGKAAGKFALSNPLDGTGDAGHFTANATLTAKFSGAGAGISGALDNFMANDKAVPWSVALNNRTLAGDTVGAAPGNNIGDDGAITSAGSFDTATPNVDESKTTVWSIDGNAAPASGTWSGQLYDEAQTGAADDGSNVPTSVTGTFQSEFGSIGSMVGAFGATK